MVGIIFAAVMALPMLALGTPATNYGNNPRLPRCSPRDVPCSCPRGTTFKNITTYAVLGAPATDLRAVMFDFFKPEWFGLSVTNPTGDGNTVGSTRTFNISRGGSSYLLTESLNRQETSADGSFVQSYSQVPRPPVVYVPGGAEYHGFYATVVVQQTILANESAATWNVYRCDVGTPFDTGPEHERAFRNVTTILESQGKHPGVDIEPYSIYY